jgi:outer membrane receptor protein involved in Fe transport
MFRLSGGPWACGFPSSYKFMASSEFMASSTFMATSMFMMFMAASPWVLADPVGSPAADPATGDAPVGELSPIQVTAKHLNEARNAIETQTGASTYTIDRAAIEAIPGGQNNQLNEVLLQAPGVVQDSFGQIHVRGDHNDLQYRLNGIILPEGISVFSQTLSPWLVSSLKLITGALPAEYGLRTAGIIDLSTNSGSLEPGGTVSVYAGSHSTFQPSAEYGGSNDKYTYYLTADYKESDLGIESPDGRSNPLHDHSRQEHAFGYWEDILDSSNRVSLIVGLSDEEFQIPNQQGLEPTLGLDVLGQTQYLSNDLSEQQHELAEYAIVTWQHSQGALDWQSSVSARYTSLHFAPDVDGDLLYDGIAQDAFKQDVAIAWQTDAAYKWNDAHTVRSGFYYQHDASTSSTASQVLPINPTQVNPNYPDGVPTSDVPITVTQNGNQAQEIESIYLQDEWLALAPFTINYGLRFDHYSAYSSGSQLSPRINGVWEFDTGTTLHGGYSRYFTPPPFELVGAETFTLFAGTTALPPGSVTRDTAPVAERSNYYDLGVEQKLLDKTLTLGVDSFYKQSQNLIDEGQFGAPIILTPFNYRWGLIGGIELSVNYTIKNFSAYLNSAWQAAHGKGVESAQFNFAPQQLAYIATHYIALDHEARASSSGGVAYQFSGAGWSGTRISVDEIFGTGLREDLVYPDGFVVPNGTHTPSYLQVNLGLSHDFAVPGAGAVTARFDVVNVGDKVYQIRSGNGIGVFAPQYGQRRGFFGGLAWKF